MQGSAPDNPIRSTGAQRWWSVDFDQLDYNEALSLQHALVSARRSGVIKRNILLLLEHPPVFTLGRRGGSENLKVSSEFLKKHDIASEAYLTYVELWVFWRTPPSGKKTI